MKKIAFLLIPLMIFATACSKEEAPVNRVEMSDKEFLSSMIDHHQEAIDSSEMVLLNSTNEGVKALAQQIVTDQKAEITQMENWEIEWFGKASDSSDYTAMMHDLSSLSATELDRTYLEAMEEHHQAAVDLANAIRMHTNRKELIYFAKEIIAKQSAEIDQIAGLIQNLE